MPIDVSDLELPGLAALPGYVDGHVPGWALHQLLEEIDPATLATDYEVIDYVAAWDRVAPPPDPSDPPRLAPHSGELVWTYPTGHRYRVAPDPPDDPDPLTELDAA